MWGGSCYTVLDPEGFHGNPCYEIDLHPGGLNTIMEQSDWDTLITV